MRIGSSSTVAELAQELTELAEAYPDAVVRVAYQPIHPLRARIANIVHEEDITEPEVYEDPTVEDNNVVWIAIENAPYGENPYDVPTGVWEG